MKKGFAVFLLAIGFFVGLCSEVGAKTHLEKAKEDLAVVDVIAGIPNPQLRHSAIMEYLERIGPAIKAAVEANPDLNKFAWNIGGSRWWVIYEHKTRAIASAWLCKGDPPKDAKIL